MPDVESVLPDNAIAFLILDEELAARSAAKVLITAETPREAAALARRLHAASERAACPFIRTDAGDLPVKAQMLRQTCGDLLDAAAGGTLFISDVEEMPGAVQNVFVELLGELESARPAADAVRIVAGTTASLLDWAATGRFSERLFYQLNTIHLIDKRIELM
jgi:DNA-binding NtrC family response regulator